MRPVADLEREPRRLRGLIFDLDDTLLDHGALREDAYASLFRAREAGLHLIACTGRPAGWASILVRQWPIDFAIAENGAAIVAASKQDGRVSIATQGDARRDELLALANDILARHPSAALADDNVHRCTDVTIDIGEHRVVPTDEAVAMADYARRFGVRTTRSSVHLHLTRSPDDKASGALRALRERFNEDATAARSRWAYAGDSGNDAAAFAAFDVSIGVANVRRHLHMLTVPPRYVTNQPMGQGFAEMVRSLVVQASSLHNGSTLEQPFRVISEERSSLLRAHSKGP